MPTMERYPYLEIDPVHGNASAMPYVPLTLGNQGHSVSVSALVDSGSTLNVLPYDIGTQLGAKWDEQTVPLTLTGNLGKAPARAIVLIGQLVTFPPLRLAFAWTRNNDLPVILGQVNFFMEYDVCFFRSQMAFEITQHGKNG